MRKPKPIPRPRKPAKASPARRAPTYDDLLAIARLVESSARFTEVRLRSGDIEVEVKRANGQTGPAPSPVPAARGDESPARAAATPSPAAPSAPDGGARGRAPPAPDIPAGAHVVRAPMIGTLYRAPEPGAKPFVEPGTRVKPGSVVCIIEVMKLMNSIEAGVAGVVTHVYVDNAQPVEPGQPLVAIRPGK